MVSRVDPASASAVAERARTENFPVASLLFPRAVRPHLRAIYGFARLVDILGDEARGRPARGARRARARARRLLRRRAGLVGDARAAADDPRVRPPARAVPAPDRGEPDGSADLGVRDLGRPQGLLRALGRPGRPARARRARPADEADLVALSDDVCTGLQLVNFLQDVPRDLALGRVYLPAEDRRRFGVTELDGPNEPLRRLLVFEAERARGLLASGEDLRRAARRAHRPGGRACSPAAGSRPSRPWSGPTGTSSTGGRARRARGWRSRLIR